MNVDLLIQIFSLILLFSEEIVLSLKSVVTYWLFSLSINLLLNIIFLINLLIVWFTENAVRYLCFPKLKMSTTQRCSVYCHRGVKKPENIPISNKNTDVSIMKIVGGSFNNFQFID